MCSNWDFHLRSQVALTVVTHAHTHTEFFKLCKSTKGPKQEPDRHTPRFLFWGFIPVESIFCANTCMSHSYCNIYCLVLRNSSWFFFLALTWSQLSINKVTKLFRFDPSHWKFCTFYEWNFSPFSEALILCKYYKHLSWRKTYNSNYCLLFYCVCVSEEHRA